MTVITAKFLKNSVGWVKERNPTNQMTMVLIRSFVDTDA